MNQPETLNLLFQKFLDNKCSPQEVEQLFQYFNLTGGSEQLQQLIVEEMAKPVPENATANEQAFIRVENKLRKMLAENDRPTKLYPIRKMAIAAMVLVCASVGLYYYMSQNDQQQQAYAVVNDVMPGTDKATLTLADGRTIDLNANGYGTLAQQGNISITKTKDGQLVYSQSADVPSTNGGNGFNTIATPKGGQYQLLLPDGTHVWLNAASSLRYNADLSQAATRTVELNGEAYFEVAHNKNKPFIVKTAAQSVTVLGTHFNINSYADEGQTLTTLTEGKVNVLANGNSQQLKPGQQAQTTINGKIVLSDADVETVLAWKNGLMKFSNAPLPSILRQLSRWYDIDIAYQEQAPAINLSGTIPRKSTLSTVLRILELSNVQFRIVENQSNGRKLLQVLPHPQK